MSSVAFEVAGLGDDALAYEPALELQRRVHAAVVAGERGDTVLLEAQLTLACIDLEKMRAIRLPPEVAAACRP